MNAEPITCPLCGSTFQPSGQEACAACPLHGGCGMVCCPNCGYTMLAPRSTLLAHKLARWLDGLRPASARARRSDSIQARTLQDAPVGAEVRVVSIDALAPEHYDWLQSYGVRPGHYVRVLQHRPLTIVQVEQTELAVEAEIASAVLIDVIS